MGPYDNESSTHIYNSTLIDHAHWFIDQDSHLYIVGDDSEIEGPETPVLDSLESHYRHCDSIESTDPCDLAKQLGIEYVFPWQRRFDPKAGYYVA